MLSLRLKESGEAVLTANSGSRCLELLEQKEIDVVILDVKMPGMDGIETLQEVKRRHPLVEVIMLTGHGTIDTAVEGMKLGAFDFLLKPADFQHFREVLNHARERKRDQMDRIRNAQAAMLLQRSDV